MAVYNDKGQEVPDPVPMAVPHGWDRPLSLHEQIKRFVRSELSSRASAQGHETFEEADDFDVDEDPPEWASRYEVPEAVVEWPGGVKDVDADPPLDPAQKAPVASSGASEGPTKG